MSSKLLLFGEIFNLERCEMLVLVIHIESTDFSQLLVLVWDQCSRELHLQLWLLRRGTHKHIPGHRHLRATVGHQEMKGSISLEGDEWNKEKRSWRKRSVRSLSQISQSHLPRRRRNNQTKRMFTKVVLH